MNCCYADILSRIPDPPKWWDEHAVPRYCDFSPEQTADIYASECALVLIRCQSCGREFQVALSASVLSGVRGRPRRLHEQIRNRTLHYGDPPNAGCCYAGPTMTSEPVRVLEYWRRDGALDWCRDPALEVELEDA